MRIDFRTNTGKLLGSVTELQFATSWGALAAITMFFMTSGETLFAWFHVIIFDIKLTDIEPGADLSPILYGTRGFFTSTIFFFARLLATICAFYFATNRLFKGMILYFLWKFQHGFEIEKFLSSNRIVRRLSFQKLSDEIWRYPNTSAESFLEEINLSKIDELNLGEAARTGLITNETVMQINWNKLDLYNKLSSASQNDERLVREICDTCDFIRQRKSEWSGKIDFFVSPVQPSIIYAIDDIKRNYGFDFVNIKDEALTGPRTLSSAVTAIKTRDSDDSNVIMCVAPLSAYVMFDGNDLETLQQPVDLKEKFDAKAVVICEQQSVLVLDDARRTPVRKNKLIYYNNSTAEECWSLIDSDISSLFERDDVDSYGDYLALLSGRETQLRKKLRAGDAVITWPPLTSFFKGKEIDGAHFSAEPAFEKGARTTSRILLFVEKNDLRELADARQSVANAFAELLILHMYKLHNDLRRQDRSMKQRMRQFSQRSVSLTRKLLGLDMGAIRAG
jgi:hypothetical protein